MTAPLPLQSNQGFVDRLRNATENAIVDSVGILSELVVALLIVLLGYWIAGKAKALTLRLGHRVNLDGKVSETPLAPLFADQDGAATAAFAAIVRYYVILVAGFAALEHVGFTVVTQWLSEAVTYVPIFLGGLVIFILGFYVSDYAARAARNSETAQSTGLPHVFGDVTRGVLYFVVVVIGLDTIGVSIGILYVVGEAFALGAALAVALAVGIGFGWGAKDYVAENVADWHEQASQD